MCTYRENPDFQRFQNWNHFYYSQYIRELKDDRKLDDLARLSFRKETLFQPESSIKHDQSSLGTSQQMNPREINRQHQIQRKVSFPK